MNKYPITSTCLSILTTLLFFEYSDIDTVIQSYFYNVEAGKWLVHKNEKLPRLILYDGIKLAYAGAIIYLIVFLALFKNNNTLIIDKSNLRLVLFSMILVPLITNILKSLTNMPCPSDTLMFGGLFPNVSLFESYPSGNTPLKNIRCYPAGHASGGFSLMSLFFLFHSKALKITALVFALSLGWILGIYKMLIGDHFFSHTLVSMELSWLIILCIRSLNTKKGFKLRFPLKFKLML